MTRIVAVISAAAIVLLTGFVHGTWMQRWSPSADVDAAVARLDAIPTQLDGWKAGDAEPIAPDELRAAGVQGYWSRTFTSKTTGERVVVVVLCGSTGQMCLHRPENCYPAQGYDLAAAPLRYVVKTPDGGRNGEFWTARFAKPEVPFGGSPLRILWAWDAAGQWQAPDYPRWTFASLPYLYKLYVIRALPLHAERLDDDPATEFLRRFLPELTKALAPA
jgi:Protein of unknown function (DUF3485)